MKSNFLLSALVFIASIIPFCALAEDTNEKPLRPVNSAYTIDIGGASVLDTYLTPIRYKGVNLRLGYERLQAMKFNPYKWSMQMAFGVNYNNVKNIVKNRTMHDLSVDFTWGMMHRWNLFNNKLRIYGGGSTTFWGGAIYNQYNSNNPVSLKINFDLNFTGMAVYNTNIGKLPITLRYQPTIPFAGVFFSPDYGEAFYEIYVGNHSGLAHFGWWGNHFEMTNLVTADLHFGNTCLRLGYRNNIRTSWICNINTQIFTNSAVIGIAGDWINLSPKNRLNSSAKIISTLY